LTHIEVLSIQEIEQYLEDNKWEYLELQGEDNSWRTGGCPSNIEHTWFTEGYVYAVTAFGYEIWRTKE